jgi:hypothetical protein
MVVDKKIEASEFFLKKIKEENENEIGHYFSAFVTSTKSIPDVLLSDFAEIYELDIPLVIKKICEKNLIKKL